MAQYGDIIELPRGRSTIIADLDFETYSEAGYMFDESKQKWTSALPGSLKKGLSLTGAAAYTEHSTCEILSCAYDLKDGKGPRLWTPGHPPPLDLFEHIYTGGLIEAWNVTFERLIWTNVCHRRYDWPQVPLGQWRDAMAKSMAFGLPRSLAAAGEVLGIQNKKLSDGARLITKFCIPRNPTSNDSRRRQRIEDDLKDAENLYNYNIRDIEAEAEISAKIPDLNDFEQKFWIYDQRINERGIMIDLKTIKSALHILERLYPKYNKEIHTLTHGAVSTASEVQKILKLVNQLGLSTASLDDDNLTELLNNPQLPSDLRRVLEIRKLLSSAAVKKLYSMRMQVTSDSRLHDLLIYHGARTGREAGAGVQPQNLPGSGPRVVQCECDRIYSIDMRRCPDCLSFVRVEQEWGQAAIEQSIELIRTETLECLEYYHSDSLKIMAGCLRSLFIAKPRHELICSDYSAIEAVVLAALAGERWRLDVFKTHGKIYELSASKISGVPFEEFEQHRIKTGNHHPLRKKLGKVAELASGYSGWIGAWKQFGAGEFYTDDEIKESILRWRAESPAIVNFWGGQSRNRNKEFFGLEGAAISAILNPGYEYRYLSISYQVLESVLYCRLPSGRFIVYHQPRLIPSTRRPGEYTIVFKGANSNPKMGKIGWVDLETYGGKLTENVVQAVARDILANAIINLEDAGYPVVLHVHDEIIAEVPRDTKSLEEFEQIMSKMPDWAHDWPVKAQGGWRGERYRK